MTSLAINNARIFDGKGWIGEGGVLAENGRIAAVGGNYQAEYAFDAKGAIVAPGLVDVHVHFRGITDDIYGTSADCCCFPFGVTAAADCGAMFGDEATLNAFAVKSLVFASVGFLPNGEPGLREAEERMARYGSRAIGFKFVYDCEIPGRTETLRKIVRRARELGKKVTVHTNGSAVPMAEIAAALGKGDILTHVYHGGMHTSADDGFRCLFDAKRRGVVVDAGMAGHVHTDFRILRAAVEAGAEPDVIGTDVTRYSTFTRGGRYGMTMCMSIARDAGMSETNVLRAVTSAAAEALGKGEEWGRIAVGRAADLAVIGSGGNGYDLTDRAGNRAFSEKGYECLLTVANGEVVYSK